MKSKAVIQWAIDYLISKEYTLTHSPEILMETPWSSVIRFFTSKEMIYLKQTPPALFLEPRVMQLLEKWHANVPSILACNDSLHCFLMKDAGQTLRHYLKTKFKPSLLIDAIKQFTHIQRLAENHLDAFFALNIPDWRMSQLPELYQQLISKKSLLQAAGITEDEILILHTLKSNLIEQCKAVLQYAIPETLVQPDFNTNNILYDTHTGQMTLIDLGEITITHPFFSLYNFLLQATIHHDIKENDAIYSQLLNTCCENWLTMTTKERLFEAFNVVKKLWPIYAALAYERLSNAVGSDILNSYYTKRPNQLSQHLREYINC